MDILTDVIFKRQTIFSVVVIILACLGLAFFNFIYKKYTAFAKSKDENIMIIRFLPSIVRAMIIVLAALTVLQVNGINVSSAIAGLGLVSAIIGLAIQDVLKDFIMGIHIISDKFFAVGDVVRYKDVEGVVIGFNMRATTLRSIVDNTVTTICNRNISEITKMPQSVMVDIDLSISYEEDYKKVNKLLLGICEEIGKIDGVEQSVYKGTQEFSHSAVIYKLRFYCTPETKFERKRDALRLIQEGLFEAGIQIPYNKLDVHTY